MTCKLCGEPKVDVHRCVLYCAVCWQRLAHDDGRIRYWHLKPVEDGHAPRLTVTKPKAVA